MNNYFLLLLLVLTFSNLNCSKLRLTQPNPDIMNNETSNRSMNNETISTNQNFNNNSNISDTNPPTIQVIGSSSGNAKTDIVRINVEIDSRDPTAAGALKKNTIESKSAFNYLTSFNLSKQNITTSGFTFGPEYNSTWIISSGTYSKVFLGYLVTNSLQLQLGDTKKAGDIIDAVSRIDGAQINGIDFLVSPEKQNDLQNLLIDAAMKDAENKANLALKPINYKILSVQSIIVGNGGLNYAPVSAQANSFSNSANNSPTLFQNYQQTNIQITVTYNIGHN